MSIINNVHPGSDINLLCLIDRELVKRKGEPVNQESLLKKLRPENLPNTTTAGKKAKETLNFWIDRNLWTSQNGAVYLSQEKKNDVLQKRVLEAIFADSKDLDLKYAEPLVRTIACLLEVDELSPFGSTELLSKTLKEEVNKRLKRDYHINENEDQRLMEYARFLGFAEQVSKGRFVMDPTRAIMYFLPTIFREKGRMNVADFLKKLCFYVPVLDGGSARMWVLKKMSDEFLKRRQSNHLSASLSYSLYRLSIARYLRLVPGADNQEVVFISRSRAESMLSVGAIETRGDTA